MSPDELDGQEERQLPYLDQEKLSYITNYLEQTRETDVHSVSTEDDSGKPGSNSAPSEFGFEETSGMTQSIQRVPNPHPLSISIGTDCSCAYDRKVRDLNILSCERVFIAVENWMARCSRTSGLISLQNDSLCS